MRYTMIELPFAALRGVGRWIYDNFIAPVKTFWLISAWHLSCGAHVRFIGPTIIRSYEQRAIMIGKGSIFNSQQKRNLVGLVGPTVLCAMKGARIEIGDNSGFSSVVIHARELIKIGSNVKVGGNVRIFDHDFHPLHWEDRRHPEKFEKTRVQPVIIEDDVFIGTNAIILKGTHVGARSIIAAGSVVFGLHIPSDAMVKGNPAVVITQKENKG